VLGDEGERRVDWRFMHADEFEGEPIVSYKERERMSKRRGLRSGRVHELSVSWHAT
jgi:hypothetical protein